ncbi:hypothetical protein K402DRAFT_400587 [Aulographum hederae CBS 113979]|uniref:Large ribosomal subunit protein bL32m n=1 Tax=Aulographum hederae CBS 113979 TaxID=1176131 RepID=A0A6G1HDL2_9PEZI|nr:hypothetical protein K402DRAFT_400587 [Aulographum hederae CBS 113979]
MALRQLSSSPLQNLLSPLVNAAPFRAPILRFRIPIPIPSAALRYPTGAIISVTTLLGEIWDSVLRAVPKKKVSHMKRRHRQNANKGLKDVTELTRCPGCGRAKRAHILCPYCVIAIKKKLSNVNVPGIARKEKKQWEWKGHR